MPLRWSIFGAIVGGAYVLSAAFLVSSEIHGNGCMGWCFALATFPEFFLLQALPTSYFYTSGWEHSIVWVFGAGAIGFTEREPQPAARPTLRTAMSASTKVGRGRIETSLAGCISAPAYAVGPGLSDARAP